MLLLNVHNLKFYLKYQNFDDIIIHPKFQVYGKPLFLKYSKSHFKVICLLKMDVLFI